MMRGGQGSRLGWISAFGVVALLAAVWGGRYLPGTALESWLTLSRPALSWWLMATAWSRGPAGLVAARAARLPQHLHEDRHGGAARPGHRLARAGAEDAGPDPVHPRQRPILPGPVFPFCFITIACAAISGFHSLIASGTTPKLIANENHIRVSATAP